MSSSSQLAAITKMISDLDATLKADQSNIKTAITSAMPKITAAITANIGDIVNFNLQMLRTHIQRVLTCADHPVDYNTITSCTSLLALVGKAQFRGWMVMQRGITERNSTMAAKYLSRF
jgi:hypothetical protein